MRCLKKKPISVLMGIVILLSAIHVNTYAQNKQSFAQTIARDLVGQVITDPPQTYFPEEWRWQLQRGEVLSVDVKEAKNNSKKYAAIIVAHLKRGHLLINAKMHIKYHYNGKKWILTMAQVKFLNIPKQKDYSQYVSLHMDYDFLPTLVLKNKCDRNLFVRVELLDNDDELKYMSVIVEPYKEASVCIGAPQNYRVIYAYQK